MNINRKDHLSFLREIHILTSNYPTILKLEGWCVIDKIFILTEYMTKETLNDKINDSSISCTAELTPTQKQIILYGISNGEYLHSKKIINVDFKPSNILLDKNLCPKISDFNLSKFISNIDHLYDCSHIFGTFRFISPEIYNEKPYNGKIDVFSFGITAYELITNQPFNIEDLV